MRHINLIYIILFVAISIAVKSQDAHFSQYYSSPLYLSPSLAGATDNPRLIINYRNQWPSLSKAYVHYALSFDHPVPEYKSGVGLLVLRSQEGGVYNTTNIGVLYNYNIDINREIKIRPGIKAGYYFRNVDYSNISFADQITRDASSSIEMLSESSVRHYDFSASVLAHTSFYWLGFTGDHLLAVNKQFRNDPTYPAMKILLYGGAQLQLFESVLSKVDRTFSLSFLYKHQAGFNQLDLGAYYEEEPFRVGLFFRGVPIFNQKGGLNAIVLMAGYTYRQILVNYSYDISTSRLLAATGGAHEVSLAYKFRTGLDQRRNRKYRAVPCPHF